MGRHRRRFRGYDCPDADREQYIRENAVAVVNDRERQIDRLQTELARLNKRISSYKRHLNAQTERPAIFTDWTQTRHGHKWFSMAPREEDVDIRDIAHALAMTCRFGGMSSDYFTVAQHCVLVSTLCPPEDALWGLMHDAAEAYLRDIPTPTKHAPEMLAYRQVEKHTMRVICRHFMMPVDEPPSVKAADGLALMIEAANFMQPYLEGWNMPLPTSEQMFTIRPMDWREAKAAFLTRWVELAQA